jgi:hypothetical protein
MTKSKENDEGERNPGLCDLGLEGLKQYFLDVGGHRFFYDTLVDY